MEGRGGALEPAESSRDDVATTQVAAAARRHWLFLTFFAGGFALRIVTMIAYRPAFLYIDSFRYLANLHRLDPTGIEPIGYDLLLLRPVLALTNLAAVAVLQHVLGLAMGVAIYALVLRRGVRRWLAALATLPVLLDAYQLQIEHNIMSDALFEALVLSVVVILLWQQRPTYRACAAAGAILGIAVTVRLVGIPLIVPAALFVVLAGRGLSGRVWKTAVLVAAFAVPLSVYAAYYHDQAGRYALTSSDAGTLYGRAAVIADCSMLHLPSYERVLCPKEPLGQRSGDRYAHDPTLLAQITPPPGMDANDVVRDFSVRVFRQQPFDLTTSVLSDFLHGFVWSPSTQANDPPLFRWQFQLSYPRFPPNNPTQAMQSYGERRSVVEPLARFLRRYQLSIGFVPRILLGLCFLAGLLGTFGAGRARRSELRLACLLATLFGLGLLLTADFFEFSWRYQLPALVLAPIAGAFGISALLGWDQSALTPSVAGPCNPVATRPSDRRHGPKQIEPALPDPRAAQNDTLAGQ